MTTKVRAIRNFDYPGDPEVRASIKRFHSIKKNDGVSYPGDRGPTIDIKIGDEIEVTDDLMIEWADMDIVEVI